MTVDHTIPPHPPAGLPGFLSLRPGDAEWISFVAQSEEPIHRLAAYIRTEQPAYVRRIRLVKFWAAMTVIAGFAYLLAVLVSWRGFDNIPFDGFAMIPALTLAVSLIGIAYTERRNRAAHLTALLLEASRESAQPPGPEMGAAISLSIDAIAAVFYKLYKRPRPSGARQYRLAVRKRAQECAAVIESLQTRTLGELGDYNDVRVALTRVLLRVEAGKWYEVKYLRPDGDEFPRYRRTKQRILLTLTQETTAKTTAAMLGVIAALVTVVGVLAKALTGQ